MTTKVDRINSAYSQLRISGLTVQPSPEDMVTALDRLENMMAEWESRNVCLNYIFEAEPDPNSLTGVDRAFYQAIDTNLAIRLVPDFNKDVSPVLFQQASQSYSNASARVASDNARQVRYPHRMPRGSANTLRFNRWQRFYREENLPPNECATNIIVIGDVNDYFESFESYLRAGESIQSFVISADPGLVVVSSAIAGDRVNYRIRAEDNSTEGPWQQVKIVATISSGRVETRLINFEVRDNQTVGSN